MDKDRIFTKEYIVCMAANLLFSINFIGLLTTVSTYAMDVFRSSESAAGFAASAVVIGAIPARLFAARYALTIGYKRLLTIGLAIASLSTFAYFLADNFIIFCLVRFVNGFAFGLGSNTTTTIVTSIIPKERSGEGVGYFSMSQIVGTAIGPYIAIRLLHGAGFDSVFLFTAITPAVALPLMFFLKTQRPDGPEPAQEERLSTFSKFIEVKALPVAALSFMLYFGLSSIISFVAVFAATKSLEGPVSWFFAVYAAGLIATRPFVSKLFDKRGPDPVLYPGIAIYAVSFLLLSGSGTAPMLLASAIMCGIGIGAIQAGTLAIVVGLVPRYRLSVANGTYFMALDASCSIGPSITGLLIVGAGFRGMYMIMVAIAACGLLAYYLLYARKNR